MREITIAQATAEALIEEMEKDPTIFIIGEDLTAHGGIFGQFVGIPEKFPDRILDTPISETAIVGAGVGAALTGMRPLVDLHFADFITITMDEIVSQAATMRYMFGGQSKMPLVIWAPDGAGLSAGPHHSKSFEAWFMHAPGMKVVVPSTPYDVKGLLKSALRDDDLVLFFQHKKLFKFKGPVPDEEYIIPLKKADVKREGTDVTVITYSMMVHHSLEAAKRLEKEGISVEVIDLRTIWPFDFDTVSESVKKTGHVVIAHESWKVGGVGAELASQIQEKLFDFLDAPIVRVGAEHVPIPFSPPLEKRVIPDSDDVYRAVKQVLEEV